MDEITNEQFPDKVTGDKLFATEATLLKHKTNEIILDSNAKTTAISDLETDVTSLQNQASANTITEGTGSVVKFDKPYLYGVSIPLSSFTIDLTGARLGVPVAININAATAPVLPSPIQLQTGSFVANTDITLYLQYWSATKITAQYSNVEEVSSGIIADANLVEWWDSFEGVTTDDTAPVTLASWTGKKNGSIPIANAIKANQPEYASGVVDFDSTTAVIVSDNTAFELGDTDWTIGFRFKLSSIGISQHVLSKWHGTDANGKCYLFVVTAANQFSFFVSADGVASTAATSTLTAVAGTEYVAFLKHDSVNNTISIKINAETPVTTSHSTGVRLTPATRFAIAGSSYNTNTGEIFNPATINSELDLVLFDKALTDQEMTDYYAELIS